MINDCSTCEHMYLNGYNNEFQMCDEDKCHYEMKRGQRAELELYDDWIGPMAEYFAGNATWDEAINKSMDKLNDIIRKEVTKELEKHEAD